MPIPPITAAFFHHSPRGTGSPGPPAAGGAMAGSRSAAAKIARTAVPKIPPSGMRQAICETLHLKPDKGIVLRAKVPRGADPRGCSRRKPIPAYSAGRLAGGRRAWRMQDEEAVEVPVRRSLPSPAGGEEDVGLGPDGKDVPRLQRGEAAGRGAASFRSDAEAGRDRRALPDRRAHPRGTRRVVARAAAPGGGRRPGALHGGGAR